MSELGRPSDYTKELGDEICARLADGVSLRSICRDERMPSKTSVFRWLRTQDSFRDQYAISKAESAEALVEDMQDIADDGSNDWMEANDPDNPGYRINGEAIQRSRLRLDFRKWAASKLKPKKYGDFQRTELTGADGGAINVHTATMSDEALKARAAELLAKGVLK